MKVTLFRDLPSEGWPSMERYADELAAALRSLGCDVREYVLPRPFPRMRGRVGALANHAWRYLVYPLAARTQRSDVYHIADHSYAHLLYALDPRRTIVTCHDIAPMTFDPPGLGLSHLFWQSSYQAMLRAARIIAISHFTRQEVLSHSQYPPDCITPIWYGLGRNFHERVDSAHLQALRERYAPKGQPLILHVGSCLPRKNVEFILKALPALLDLQPIFAQVGGKFTPSQRHLLRTLGLQTCVIQTGPLTGSALTAWYQAADVFVFPSFYEGFGMPVLEAMASGTPVVCANTSSLPEVAGDAALLVDPHDASALAAAIRAVLSDRALRDELIRKGLARSREFTWEQTARRTLDVYRLVHRDLAS
ncbi:MAG: glycosyltransferase family 4 protein [Anaerolineales bacterium]|nr:glycosyltransferase family 4 protein [Anaerolineales bacterium]